MKVKLIIIRVVLSVLILFFVGCSSSKKKSILETSEIDVLTNEELVEDLNKRVLEMTFTSSDLSTSIESNDSILNILEKLKENSVDKSFLYYSVNNIFLKLFLRHKRNGCSGHNISGQKSNIAEWILEIGKFQIEDKSQFSEITHSGFIYYLIAEDSLNRAYDRNLFESISLRIDSCLNYNSETYPKNFRP